jgi:hypothetical protein
VARGVLGMNGLRALLPQIHCRRRISSQQPEKVQRDLNDLKDSWTSVRGVVG